MVPAGVTGAVIDDLSGLLAAGDAVIDGGNSFYGDDIVRAQKLASAKIDFVDCGTSGGVFGLERGFCLMIGGPTDASRASTRSSARSRPGSTPRRAHARSHRRSRPEEMGYLHCGPAAPATS
jgi:6-phosphogluconate dehydrogenase